MSEELQHECGLAFVRLLKPLGHYQRRYGTALYGFQKLFLLMEKQHNRGQDGCGIGCVKLGMPLGEPYIFRERSAAANALSSIFRVQTKRFRKLTRNGTLDPADASSVKAEFDYGGELLLGHLRYGTSGVLGDASCHPYLRRTPWETKTLMVLGNFNLTNVHELNERLIEHGQHPVFGTDTQTVLEEIGFQLDQAHDALYRSLRGRGLAGQKIQSGIAERLDLVSILRKASSGWDGGYAIVGAIGTGDAFILRDPNGIRPAYWYRSEELVAFASERVPLMTVFDAEASLVREVPPGGAVLVRRDGRVEEARCVEPGRPAACSFERIYFSRGNDPVIYRERKALGAALVPQVVEAIDNDLENTVISFIPNTAEVAYHGLMDGLRVHRRHEVAAALRTAAQEGTLNEARLDELILRNWPRGEKIAHKDIKLRTFISQESDRAQLVSHVYDITYGVVRETDNLVVLDDSIVRGTTLQQSILKILSRTRPRRIIIASTAPQIRYPDCYGIDMSELGKFIAFRAAIRLLERSGRERLIRDLYEECRREITKPPGSMANVVQRLYAPFADEELSSEISRMVYPDVPWWRGEVRVLFQTIANLRASLDPGCGDWYFTGNYPTPGGTAVANRAFVAYYEKLSGRTYDLLL
ncbi:MAG TPA: amidophosphoribosyltransferase [Verrucomicrobiota bacterium]|nr:amidophosphoribosyltransferase [Verrucomicrobiota bacterium]HNU52820.1 amidophosphoribosyltransferase [Verrucomicrobiota bacterium]